MISIDNGDEGKFGEQFGHPPRTFDQDHPQIDLEAYKARLIK